MDNTKAWLLLNRTKGIGIVKIKNLLNHFESCENIFLQKSFPDHLQIPKEAQNAIINPDFNSIKKDLDWLDKENNHIICFDNALYPPLLKLIHSAPPLIYLTGDPNVLLMPQLAVVGSRNASELGLRNTRSFCKDIASKGLIITSGMALGVDGKAHQAAIEAGGQTIAVMGTGLDVVYPSGHKNLAHNIAANGALVSEFPIGTKPNAHNFPRRNRIICGLSLGTLVIEAGIKSGTLITARQTMEINRPVMAIPGSIHSPMAKGCHALIKQGAKLVESADEILEELYPLAQTLSIQIKQQLEEVKPNPIPENKIDVNDDQHNKVLNAVLYEPTPIDEIISKCNLSIQEVSSVLLILELEDKVQALSGAQFVRI